MYSAVRLLVLLNKECTHLLTYLRTVGWSLICVNICILVSLVGCVYNTATAKTYNALMNGNQNVM